MHITDRNAKKTFVLNEGTEDKVEFDWPVGAYPPGTWGARIYEGLLALRDVVTRSNPQIVPVVDGVALAWIYTSLLSERTRSENDALRKRVDDLQARIDGLESALVRLENPNP